MQLSPIQRETLLNAARASLCASLEARDPRTPAMPALDDALFDTQAGCFVSLHTLAGHHLRGCIGMIHSADPLRVTLLEMAKAVLDDRRFLANPVTAEELPDLDLEVTILSPLELAANPLDFDLLEHGIYVRCRGETGCFLPQVARETGWSREQLLARLCTEKMGLDAFAWQDPATRLYRFSATIIGPEAVLK